MIPGLLLKKLLLVTGSVTLLCAYKCAFYSGHGFDPSLGQNLVCALECLLGAVAQGVALKLVPLGLMSTSFAALLGVDSAMVSVDNSTWVEQDDPVMGGGSRGTWVVEDGIGLWRGAVTNVSFLQAPGFCAVKTVSLPAVDASAYMDGGFLLTVRSSTSYEGFKLRFQSPSIPAHHGQHGPVGSHAQGFKVPASEDGEWQSVYLPFKGFSWDWSDYTGECTTQDPDGFQHRCCSSENPDVCPTGDHLQSIDAFQLLAEGVEGDFGLDVKEIRATARAPQTATWV